VKKEEKGGCGMSNTEMTVALNHSTELGKALNEIAMKYVEAKEAGREDEAKELENTAASMVFDTLKSLAKFDASKIVNYKHYYYDEIAADLLNIYNNAFLESWRTYNPRKGALFTSFFHTVRKRDYTDYALQTRNSHIKKEIPISGSKNDEGLNPFEALQARKIEEIRGRNVEREVLDFLFQPEVKKLIEYLYAKADGRGVPGRGKAVLDEFKKPRTCGKYEVRTAEEVARSLGLDRKQVERVLNRLAKVYNSERFGPITDYVNPNKGYELKRHYLSTTSNSA
jgi:hypothetical protein